MNQFAALLRREAQIRLGELRHDLDLGRRRQRRLERNVTIEDLRLAARRAVPKVVFDFVDGGANDEVTLKANRTDLRNLSLFPKALVNVEHVDTATALLGVPSTLPLIGAPTGLTGLVHRDGEVAIARAVHAAGAIYVVSAMASYSMEEVRAATRGPLWFQLYVWRDRGLVRSMIERARDIHALALVVTVDVPLSGARERDRRNGFGIPPRLNARALAQGVRHPRWSRDFVLHPRITVANAATAGKTAEAASLVEYINSQFNPALSWADIAWLRELWSGPLVVKGILRADDARRAADAGADAVIVSNHGGRQLDGAITGIKALPAVIDSVAGDAQVYVDGGIRRGSDIVKAIALGASGCLVGRPLVYGVAAGGEEGALRAMTILRDELRLAMALSGVPDVAAIDATLVGLGHAALRPAESAFSAS